MNVWHALGVALVLCVGGTAHADQLAATQAPSRTPGSSVAAVAPDDYHIGVKDTLVIVVFDVPSLSETVQVDNTGFVNMPLIGQVAATGRTPNQLSRDIATALNAKYMKDPIVTVSVKDAASKKVTVDGEVTQPGMYEITPGTTLSQAVAMAKGPDQVADAHHVSIVRGAGQARTVSVYDLEDIRDGKAVDPQVEANDTIVVDSSGSRKFVRDFGSIFSVLGWAHP
ncbi:MAG TPA: polysaccharide biosynthesis/export family protein [Rhizomicrobium sp.]|jgi:polysaccharide export outer membrane protein|nr:polysaccharide biosynthesis/export family protein [Rhizomicrobium sp.]